MTLSHRVKNIPEIYRAQRSDVEPVVAPTTPHGRYVTFMKKPPTTPPKLAATQLVSARARDILNQLPPPHLSRLMEAGEPMRLLRGEVLFREGERGDSCYWVEKGTLKIGVSSETGEERIFSLAGAGSVVGELAILDNLPRSATVTAISDTNLRALKRAAFEAYLRQNPNLYPDVIAILVGRLRKTDEELAADSFLTVQARVARAILSLAIQIGEPAGSDLFILPATVSQRDIGAMAGVARESVSRTLSEWRRRGIITRAPRRILSVNRSKLEKEAKH